MTLHRVRGIREKTVWHVAHRIRETCERNQALFPGSAEVDQTFIGSKRPDMPKAKREPKRGMCPCWHENVRGVQRSSSAEVCVGVLPGGWPRVLRESSKAYGSGRSPRIRRPGGLEA